jgi:hypothetical protein
LIGDVYRCAPTDYNEFILAVRSGNGGIVELLQPRARLWKVNGLPKLLVAARQRNDKVVQLLLHSHLFDYYLGTPVLGRALKSCGYSIEEIRDLFADIVRSKPSEE